ncbi:MAG: glycosyltransferase, partial [Candidatus Omnitrophica bacterium]|nr:glycosyltransferase [Candidatus Omnitrophota bacterium]
LMVTNTYTPIVGGVERSIMSFSEEFRKAGHHVLVIAPEFDDMPESEHDVVRVSALRRFNGSDFSVRIPIPNELDKKVKAFQPDIVHAHHPFLLGDTALRIANRYQIPLVFTHHTKYEDYTHYVPVDSPAIKRFVIELSTGYADLSHHVIAPSQSIKDLIIGRGVKKPVSVIPTGIDVDQLAQGDGEAFRRDHGLGPKDFVIGHVGRLAEEKNLGFLCRPVIDFLKSHPQARFLVVGKGPLKEHLAAQFEQAGMRGRLCLPGLVEGQDLVNAYHAMDLFVFASRTETQGMVVAEAMAAGLPVIAVDATGVREVVKDKVNGRLLPEEDAVTFRDALEWTQNLSPADWQQLKSRAGETAQEFTIQGAAAKTLAIYDGLIKQNYVHTEFEDSPWAKAQTRLKTEWDLLTNVADAVGSVFEHDQISQVYNQSVFTKWRRHFNSRDWTARLLGLSRSANTEATSGLVMIQIDGLAHRYITAALRRGEMSFLRHLLRREGYHLEEFYSGQPSSTPAVQAELFYGVKGAVPSFSFVDGMTESVFKMIDEDSAREIERRLIIQNPGLLSGGSSYSNIYSGGAQETHFCSVDLGWDRLWQNSKPTRLLVLGAVHVFSIGVEICKLGWELLLSTMDFVRGILSGKDVLKELNFIATRMFICVLLRDLITFGARIDVV